jgi:hypothetical protein
VSERESEWRRRRVCYFSSLPSARDLALGKDFLKNLKNYFVECLGSGTRQSGLCRVSLTGTLQSGLCRVSTNRHSAKPEHRVF